MIVFLLLGCQVIDKQHEILEKKSHNLNMTEQSLDYKRGQIFGWVEIEDDQDPHQEGPRRRKGHLLRGARR